MPALSTIILAAIVVALVIYISYLRLRNSSLIKKLEETLHKNAEIGNFLTYFSRNLRTLDEFDESMNMTARYVSDLVGSASVCVFRLDGGFLRAEGISGPFPPLFSSQDYVLTKPRYILESLKRHRIPLGDGIIGEVAKFREPVLLERGEDDPRTCASDNIVPINTLMAVPMIYEGAVLGVICAVNTPDGSPFSPEQFSRLKFIASQVVLAQNIVRIYSNLSEQQRMNQELEFARKLQASLLPGSFPVWDQFSVNSFTRSAKEVSGDFYDFVEIDADRLLLVIGDASGKGVPACMVMAMTQTFIHASVKRFTTLKDLLMELNDDLFHNTESDHFITLGCCLLDKRRSTIEYARAGHTSLVMHRHNHLRRINPDGTALGLLPNELANFDTIKFQFSEGTTLLLYTDGINEALNLNQEEFGEQRLLQSFMKVCSANANPIKITEAILQAVDEFAVDAESQADDQTILIIKHA